MKIKVFIALLCVSNVVFAQDARTEQWQADLITYQQELEKRHIDLFHQIDKTHFANELNTLRDSIEQLSDWEIAVSLMRLTRKIGDGHTAVSTTNWDAHSFPIAVKKFGDEWRIVKVPKAHSDMLGASLETIDGMNIAEIERKLSTVAQYVENTHSETVRIGNYLPIGELLYALQITESPDRAVFGLRTDEGKTARLALTTLSKEASAQDKYNHLTVKTAAVKKPRDNKFDYLWYSIIAGKNATYIRFDSYPPFEEMVSFAEQLLVFVDKNQTRQLVIDLRNNGGGDLYVGLVLANALNLIDNVDWKDGVYVLTSAVTFSAGASNAALFRQLLNAKIVGTPTGSNPTGYQDMGDFILPNSNLRITYSKRLFRLQETATNGLLPDLYLEQNWVDFAIGKDNVLDNVIEMLH